MTQPVKKLKASCVYKGLIDDSAQERFSRRHPDIPITTYYYKDLAFNRTTVVTSDVLAIVIGFIGYIPNTRGGSHALSAFKNGDRLYCFNAHGKNSLPSSSAMFYKLASMYGIPKSNVYIYNGKNLQEDDPEGVCVAYSLNFLDLMATVRNKKSPTNMNSFVSNSLSRFKMKNIVKNVTSNVKNVPIFNNSNSENNSRERKIESLKLQLYGPNKINKTNIPEFVQKLKKYQINALLMDARNKLNDNRWSNDNKQRARILLRNTNRNTSSPMNISRNTSSPMNINRNTSSPMNINM